MKRPPGRISNCFPILCAMLSAVAAQCAAAQMFPPQFRDIGIVQRMGAQIPLDAQFRDQNGATVRLGDYFHGIPVLLVPVYYTCTTLCGETLRGLVEGISPLSLRPGKDYEIVAFSINPAESPADALEKLNQCTMNYSGKRGGPGWHFLTGDENAIRSVANAIGFHYRYDPQQHMFIHAAGMMILTPGGKVSHYLFGITFQPKELQDGFWASAHGSIAAQSSVLRLLCYPFTAGGARYDGAVINAVQIGAALMLLVLLGGLGVLWRNDLKTRVRFISSRRRL